MRSSLQVTWSVWHALFIREALMRTMANRFAWLWMIAEPLLWVLVWVTVHSFYGGGTYVMGAERIPWLIVGLLSFYMFREGMTRSMAAVNANSGLFSYRQVKPVDPVLVRCFLEGILKTIVLILMVVGASLLGYEILPAHPLQTLFAWGSMWLFGLSVGLVVSVGAVLIPEIAIIIRVLTMPMFILSGALFPFHYLPPQVLHYLLYYPVVHGVEYVRVGFFAGYNALDGLSVMYLWYWILGTLALGLALHLRFAARLRAK